MTTYTQVCGIDVSKAQLDYYLSQTELQDNQELEQVQNELGSIYERFSQERFKDTLFVLEATGNYSAKVLHQLSRLGHIVSVVSPMKSKSYMAALGISNKTDKQAAFCLTLMGHQMPLKLYTLPSEQMQKRKQILSTLKALEKQRQMLRNQIHALEQLPVLEQQAMTSFKAVLQSIEAQIQPLKEMLYKPSEDALFEQKKKLATSVIGIGEKTAEALLVVTNGLEDFDTPEKVSKFLGLTPMSHHSGTSVRRRGSITKFGSSEVRSLLYMCTRSAIRYNLACRALYLRLRKNGKPHKLAAVAVMHKLVKQVFACVKYNNLFDNQYYLKFKNEN